MGTVITNSGTQITMEEVDGQLTLQELYEEVACPDYTDSWRVKLIEACGKLARQGWGILPCLHELSKSNNNSLSKAAKIALGKIDPGAPLLSSAKSPELLATTTVDRTYTEQTNRVSKQFPYQTATGVTIWKTLEVKKVTITEEGSELADGVRVSGNCYFCGKTMIFTESLRQCTETIAGPDKQGRKRLYCTHCLRNDYYKVRHIRNTLMLSFRGIIGYYYYCFHQIPKNAFMWLSDLEAYINLHVKVGIQNPLFRYDPESLLWFVDFSKVGIKPRQMPLSFVLDTVADILAAFNLHENVREASTATLFNKFREAIVDFHNHRRRPNNQRILVPTLYGCGIPHETALNKAIPVNWLRDFTPAHMTDNFKKGYKA